jgi:hypothetical protein
VVRLTAHACGWMGKVLIPVGYRFPPHDGLFNGGAFFADECKVRSRRGQTSQSTPEERLSGPRFRAFNPRCQRYET